MSDRVGHANLEAFAGGAHDRALAELRGLRAVHLHARAEASTSQVLQCACVRVPQATASGTY